MLAPFQDPFFQRALLAALLIGFTNGFFSGFVVLRRTALSVSALSHTMLPGIALGILVTGALTQANAFIGALAAAMFVGLGSVVVSRASRVAQGTALAVLYTTAFAAGVAILPLLDTATELEEWLFGDITSVSDADLWIAFAIAGIILVFSNLFFRPLLLTLFEPSVAAAQGVPVRAMNYLLFGLLILALVASLQAVGCVLSVGLLVAPAATLSLLTNRTQWLFWGGALLGAAGSVGALLMSWHTGLPAGPSIVIVLGFFFLLAFLLSPKYGLLPRMAAAAHRSP
ncbi:MAG: metal ABC transporter permease [Akkermansiaceae bacterium]|nr:metal ABC transporter permease [Akkermansiaceae bacterium]